MGNNSSRSDPNRKLTKTDFEKLSKETVFSANQIATLYKNFIKVSNSEVVDNLIDIHEFQHVLGLQSTGFAERIFHAFDSDGSSKIDFFEFCRGLSALSPMAPVEEKAKFCFHIFDIDSNGYIDKQELTEIINYSLQENNQIHISPTVLNSIVDNTFKGMDSNHDGNISFSEFLSAAQKNPKILDCAKFNLDSLFNE